MFFFDIFKVDNTMSFEQNFDRSLKIPRGSVKCWFACLLCKQQFVIYLITFIAPHAKN